ncbi:MAG: hypothetical protein K8S99_01800 [Planctomycetes bacterium]|nr:hypothetical protein [Planctomycetota bacterium]
MSQFNAPAYDIARPTGECAFTGRKLAPGEHYMAVLVEIDPSAEPVVPATAKPGAAAAAALGFKRIDVSVEAWEQGSRPERVFSFWRSTVPEPNAKKKLFVSDEVLVNIFRRLSDAEQADRQAFRFVLGLILMRKRLLRYDGSERSGEGETALEHWLVVPRGEAEPIRLLNPHLDDARIQQVTEQLSEVLEAEL